MTNLNYYLTQDHSARRRTMLLSIAIGAAAGMISELSGIPFNTSALLCGLAIGAVELTAAFRY